MRIYNLGSMNVDYVYSVEHFVSAGETLASNGRQVFPGGKGLNQSVALARAGAKVIHGGRIGEGGELLLEVLRSEGVDCSHIQKIQSPCGHTVIQVDPQGQNCILLFPGSNQCIDRAYIEGFLADAGEGDILLLQNEISALADAFEIAHSKEMQIAFNPSPYHSSIHKLPLQYVRWWFCNEIEGEAFFGCSEPKEIAGAFARQFPDSCLILTIGENGSVFTDTHTYIEQPIYKVRTVDTTAAGDTFTGYFLAALTKGEDVTSAMNIASKAAAITVSRSGAASSIPMYDELWA